MHLTPLSDRLQFSIKILFINDFKSFIHLTRLLWHILDCKFVVIKKFKNVLLSLLKAERCWNFIIYVELYTFKDNIALIIDHISKTIYQVTPSVDKPFHLIHKFSALPSHDNEITQLINLELSHNIV